MEAVLQRMKGAYKKHSDGRATIGKVDGVMMAKRRKLNSMVSGTSDLLSRRSSLLQTLLIVLILNRSTEDPHGESPSQLEADSDDLRAETSARHPRPYSAIRSWPSSFDLIQHPSHSIPTQASTQDPDHHSHRQSLRSSFFGLDFDLGALYADPLHLQGISTTALLASHHAILSTRCTATTTKSLSRLVSTSDLSSAKTAFARPFSSTSAAGRTTTALGAGR